MADSSIQLPPDSTGKKLRTNDRGTPGHDQYVIPTDDRLITFRGRVGTFRTPGRAGTTGAKLFAIYNKTGSGVKVDVDKIYVDCLQTVVIAVTVLPPIIRVYKVTVLPTNGTSLTKVAEDSVRYTGASNANVVAFGDASADGTSSGTALTATLPGLGIVAQEFAPRLITAAGYEMFDKTVFFDSNSGDEVMVLDEGQGLVLALDYTTTTANPSTTHWTAVARYSEYTRP